MLRTFISRPNRISPNDTHASRRVLSDGSILPALAVVFGGIGAMPPSATAQSVDLQRQDRQRTQMIETDDGVVVGVVGQEFATPGSDHISTYSVMGVGSDPLATFDGALALSRAIGRPIHPVLNNSALVNARSIFENRFILAPEILNRLPSGFESRVKAASQVTSDITGRGIDAARTIVDRFLPPSHAIEPSTDALKEAVLADLTAGKHVEIVAHSQGTVITQNTLLLVTRELDRRVAAGTLTSSARADSLSRLHVYATGAFADPNGWPSGIAVRQLNNPTDPIPALGGSLPGAPWSSLDFSFQAHSFVSEYVPWVAAEMKGQPWCSPTDSSPSDSQTTLRGPLGDDSLSSEESALIGGMRADSAATNNTLESLKQTTASSVAEMRAAALDRIFTDGSEWRVQVTDSFRNGLLHSANDLQLELESIIRRGEKVTCSEDEVICRVLVQGAANACHELDGNTSDFEQRLAEALRDGGGDSTGFRDEINHLHSSSGDEAYRAIGESFARAAKKIGRVKLQELVLREVSGLANRLYCTKDAALSFAIRRWTVNNQIGPRINEVMAAPTDAEAERIISEFERARDKTWSDFKAELGTCWSDAGPNTPISGYMQRITGAVENIRQRVKADEDGYNSARRSGAGNPSMRPIQSPGPSTPIQPSGPIPDVRPLAPPR